MNRLIQTDRRFAAQFSLVLLLGSLPLSMIAVKGSSALIAIISADAATASSPAQHSPPPEPRMSQPVAAAGQLQFGVYDPDEQFAGDRCFQLKHIYCSWAELDLSALDRQLHHIVDSGCQPLLTIEPRPLAGSTKPLLEGVVAGEYDPAIDELAKIVDAVAGPVYVSWGHEMDQQLVDRYPWSGATPSEYIAAYRYVVDRFRQHNPNGNIRWIWAAVIKHDSLKYWPGDTYADYVGMPIYSFPAWDRLTYGTIRHFRTTLAEKVNVVQQLNKPLMITELGVSGSDDFTSYWLSTAFEALDEFPGLAAVVFFQARDSEGVWGADVSTPDWQIHPQTVRSLVTWKLEQQTPPASSTNVLETQHATNPRE